MRIDLVPIAYNSEIQEVLDNFLDAMLTRLIPDYMID